jgi:hypothetical protein
MLRGRWGGGGRTIDLFSEMVSYEGWKRSVRCVDLMRVLMCSAKLLGCRVWEFVCSALSARMCLRALCCGSIRCVEE